MTTQTTQTELLEIIDKKRKSTSTRSLDISFNELADMYNEKELIIQPEYQRLFRWNSIKQSQFIESLILELPIPPIFVIENEHAQYELVDGLQRMSSYLNFRDLLDNAVIAGLEIETPLKLEGCDIIHSLNEKFYDDLPQATKIRLKRNFIRVEVIEKGDENSLQYDMFKRLNSGGEVLEDQEIRNCTIRILGPEFIDFINDLRSEDDFRECIATITDEKYKQKYDQELVLRFFAFKNNISSYNHIVKTFLTDYMEKVTKQDEPFDYENEKLVFQKTFNTLAQTLKELSFSRKNANDNFIAGFTSLHYDAITVGITRYIEDDDINTEDQTVIESIKERLFSLKSDDEFKSLTTGGGKNSRRQLEQRIEYVLNWLRSDSNGSC